MTKDTKFALEIIGTIIFIFLVPFYLMWYLAVLGDFFCYLNPTAYVCKS